jgi:hypothetical protein
MDLYIDEKYHFTMLDDETFIDANGEKLKERVYPRGPVIIYNDHNGILSHWKPLPRTL